jgi:demethoxyubiquinone hydroxylase (CLK1/Coq7/Cat5 family)
MAYSGEKAAGYAYNAHWRSVKHPADRAAIQKIESEEWAHRTIVGRMLEEFGATPQMWRECMMAVIGRTVGFSCYIIGWFLPMYFAGRLESANIKEYEHAAYYARQLGLNEYAGELMRLSSVEAEHESFFLDRVTGHPYLPAIQYIFKWGPSIRLERVK